MAGGARRAIAEGRGKIGDVTLVEFITGQFDGVIPIAAGGGQGGPYRVLNQNFTVPLAKRSSALIWLASHCRELSLRLPGIVTPLKPGARMSLYQ